MKNTEKKKINKNSFGYKLCKKLGKLGLIILGITALVIAVMNVISTILTKSSDEKNLDREYKEYWNFAGCKGISLAADNVAGIISKNICASTKLDFTETVFKADSFISLSALCSAVEIIVPADVNVKCDGLITNSTVSNDTVSNDELPTLYIACKCNFSAVRIASEE